MVYHLLWIALLPLFSVLSILTPMSSSNGCTAAVRSTGGLAVFGCPLAVSAPRHFVTHNPTGARMQQGDEAVTATVLLEFVDFAGLSQNEVASLVDQRILTSAQDEMLRMLEASGNAEARAFAPTVLHPRTGEPFPTILTGAELSEALAQFDNLTGGYSVAVELTDLGARKMSDFTESRVGESMAVVVDSVVLSAPVIRDRLDRRFVIESNFTQDEATLLATRLRSASSSPEQLVPNDGPLLPQLSVDGTVVVGLIGMVFTFVLTILL